MITVDNVLNGYMKRARQQLSQSISLKYDNEEAAVIVNNYDGDISEYIVNDRSTREFIDDCLNYALHDTFDSIHPLDYYNFLVDAQKIGDHKINNIIYDIDEKKQFETTGIEFIDVSEYQKDVYGDAVFEILDYLSSGYDEQLLMYYEGILDKRVENYLHE